MNDSGGSVVWNLDVDDAKYYAGLSRAGVAAQGFASNLSRINLSQTFEQAGAAFGNIANQIGRAAMVTGVAVGALGGIFVKSAAGLEQTSTSFRVLTGDVKVANKLFAELAGYANNTPFEFPQIAKAGQTLLGFGIQSSQVLDKVKMLGDIAAATGADFNALSVVFGQVNATGRLMGQDALQLINNNIPITTILAKKLGISVQEVKKRIEAGAISVDIFNEALLETTQKGGFAFQGVDQLAKTFNGRMSTLKDTVLEFGRNLIGVKVDPALGLVVQPGGVFDLLSKAIPKITEGLKGAAPAITSFITAIVANGDTVVAALGGITAAFIAAKLAAVGFAIAAAINPFTLIAAGIVALVAGFTFLEIKFGVFSSLWASLKPVIDPVLAVFQALFGFIRDQAVGIIQMLRENWDAFKGPLIFVAAIIAGPLIVAFMGLVAALAVVAAAIAVGMWLIRAIGEVYLYLRNVAMAVADGVRDSGNIIKGVWQSIKDVIASAVGAIVGSVSNGFNNVRNSMVNGINGALGAIRGLVGSFASAGASLVQGIASGVASNAGAVISKIKQICASALDAVKSFFGIKSPSTVMAKQGSYIMQGMARGIESATSSVVATASDASAATLSAFSGGGSIGQLSVASDISGTVSGGGGANVTIQADFSGIVARSRAEWREIVADGIEAVNEDLRARGIDEIGGGQILGGSTAS